MAVVALKSTEITQRDSGLRTQAPASSGGPKRVYTDSATVEVTNGDSIASTYRLVRVRSSDRIRRLQLYCDAITSAAADFGLYKTAADGGAVVDADFFASAQSLASAILTGTDITYEANAGPADVAKIEQPLWQLLGLTSDPGIEYDIVATLTAAATASGTLSIGVDFARST